jgi:hypothetical protein
MQCDESATRAPYAVPVTSFLPMRDAAKPDHRRWEPSKHSGLGDLLHFAANSGLLELSAESAVGALR